MQDGYYLSTYLNPVGLHSLFDMIFRHDGNVSLWHKSGSQVRLERVWELERISGEKQHRTPFRTEADLRDFLASLLGDCGLSLDDVVEVWGTPGIATTNDYHLVEEHPDLAYHALTHLYSSVLLDSALFFEGTIIGLAMDRGPDRVLDGRVKPSWFAGCVVERGDVQFFPIESPGPLYGTAKDRLGMREGTLMALATSTKASGLSDRQRVIGEFDFSGVRSMKDMPAALDLIIESVQSTLAPDPRFTEQESLISAVMKEVQAISMTIVERNLDRVLDEFGIDARRSHLALSGGFALNCPTNSHLMRKYEFAGLLAPPHVSDGGQSIGIALGAFHKKFAGRFDFRFPGAYLGRSDDDLDAALTEIAGFVDTVDDLDLDTAVDDLLRHPVVWFDGRSEIGPRALGNRSLLGDPTSAETKDRLNAIKQREWWRPVAPVVLEEFAADWFEDCRRSPYMLETFTVRGDVVDRVPAVAHLDHSSRVQTLHAEQNPRLHELITAFRRRTGVPMVCNTSLNDKGEPIVDTLAEALNFCLRKHIPVAHLNGRRVTFTRADEFPETGPRPRRLEPFQPMNPSQRAEVRTTLNPHGVPDLHLYIALHNPTTISAHDLRTAEGAAAVRDGMEEMMRTNPDLRRAAETKLFELRSADRAM
ncbi:carbamoyltransferase C-terminal domain-containing protein [Lentzea cavernae]|uniref:Carbamoyltransferase n=1 Tax=Lentzea cavernae TaxID=2020703 RepID=A0ABQ3M9Q3_9PSEU|nr:carbamoyltransferase C-terminal domain-containing protein [Lentzea cavernae]GHH32451.1 hypothetical protein GCM10017774_13380 [Lentzea cavernae]